MHEKVQAVMPVEDARPRVLHIALINLAGRCDEAASTIVDQRRRVEGAGGVRHAAALDLVSLERPLHNAIAKVCKRGDRVVRIHHGVKVLQVPAPTN